MKKIWFITVIAALTLFAVFTVLSSIKNSAGKEQPEKSESLKEKGSSEDGGSKALEKTALQPCEHGMERYLCEECRYEAGVVKISDTLLGDQKKNGLLGLSQVNLKKIDSILEVTGEVQLNQNSTAHLGSAIPGILYAIETDLGKKVKKGESLFTIHSSELGKALSEYKKTLSLMKLSEKTYEREKSLFDKNISSELEVTEKQMEYNKNRADFEAAAQNLLALGLTSNEIEKFRGESETGKKTGLLQVRAPFNGTIIRKSASTGELIEPGKEVLLLSDISSVWVWADVYEKDLSRLLAARKNGLIQIRVTANAFPDRVFPGSINYIGATVDEETRTVKVRAVIKNDDQLLLAGMFCKILIDLGDSDEEVLVVPKKALLSDEGKDFVFAKWKDGYFMRRPVIKGRELFDSYEIIEGLKSGETIVSEGAFLLKSDILREKMGAGCAD
jgi:membrane fusion protein, heavy metal efflux system